MRRIGNKLASQRGETLIEVLAGMVIISLASAVFAGLVSSAGKINEKTKLEDQKFYSAMSGLEMGDVSGEDGGDSGTVTAEEGKLIVSEAEYVDGSAEATGTPETVAVTLYHGEDMYAYEYAPKTEAQGTGGE